MGRVNDVIGADKGRIDQESTGAELVTIELTLPLDEGFLRRQCPACEREFKRVGDRAQMSEQPSELYCPYCYQQSGPASWWTITQIEYQNAVAIHQVVRPQLEQMTRHMGKIRTGFVDLRMEISPISTPDPLEEPADMTRVVPECHPEEELKILTDWTLDVACHQCGHRYAPELIAR